MPMVTYPLNNIEYTAEDAELFHSTRISGVYATNAFDYSVTGADNTVVIGTGIAWIKNGDFSGKVVAQKESVALDLDLPDPNYPRIDAIVIQFDANKNASEIVVKKGTANSNPVAPSVVRTESEYELHLYHIRRNAGALTISAGNITDLRLNANYCGLMADSVTEVDTDAINAQISELIDSLRNQAAGIILAQNVGFDPSVSGFESVNVQDAIDEIFEKSEDKLDADAIIDVEHGGTGKTTLTSGYFLKGNGTSAVSVQSAQAARNAMGLGNTTGALPVANGGTGASTASDALSALGGQSNMSFATASTITADIAGNSDIPLQTYEEKDVNAVFSNGRYSSSYGYGIKSAKAGKYLISAQLNGVLSADQTSRGSISVAVRKVVNGTSSYIARGQVMFVENSRSGLVLPISIPPVVVSLEANSYLSLYVAGAWKTTANGCWLTAVYLGE